MEDKIHQILEIVTTEKELNAGRYMELNQSIQLNAGRYMELNQSIQLNADRYMELKQSMEDKIHQILEIVTAEQQLNASRYIEWKRSIEDIHQKMATKEQLQHLFETYSKDISAVIGDQEKTDKRVGVLERKVKKIEDKVA